MRRNGAFFVLGILVAAVMMPAAVVAATALVRIEGPGGNVAAVSAAKQLQAAESDPAAYLNKRAVISAPATCVVLDSRPTTKAAILSQLRIGVGGGTNVIFQLFRNRTCAGSPFYEQVLPNVTARSHSETFEPGVPVKAGGGLSFMVFGSGVSGSVSMYGYTVPPAAVP